MAKRAEGPKPHDYPGTQLNPKDTNLQYPRMRQMQEWDPVSDDLTKRPQILDAVADLIDDRPKLHQTMVYFKPSGGSGQGLHQDQQYIPIEPLVGVWIPLEPSDQHVGYMTVIPASHKFGLLEVEPADPAVSFTTVQTKVPDSAAPEIGLNMNPGDALFFHGKLIHGSYPNTTKDRWRRTFIIHYEGQHAKEFQPPQGKHVSAIDTQP